jgi:hypothetical protein
MLTATLCTFLWKGPGFLPSVIYPRLVHIQDFSLLRLSTTPSSSASAPLPKRARAKRLRYLTECHWGQGCSA